MEYEVVEKIDIDKSKCKKIGEFYHVPHKHGIFYDGPWPFPVQLLVYRGLSRCQVTPGFLKLPFILKGWINLDILLREIDLMRLAVRGKILMHASCVDNVLIVGFPNAGKTYQTYKAVSMGAKLISEEYTVIDGVTASSYKPIMRSCFSASTIKDCNIPMSLREKVWLALTTIRAKILPFMFEAVIWKNIPVSGDTSKIEKIVYGSTGEEIKDAKLVIINKKDIMAFD